MVRRKVHLDLHPGGHDDHIVRHVGCCFARDLVSSQLCRCRWTGCASSVGLSKLQKRQRWHVYFARKYVWKAFHVSIAL
jgi:hypothetical protein